MQLGLQMLMAQQYHEVRYQKCFYLSALSGLLGGPIQNYCKTQRNCILEAVLCGLSDVSVGFPCGSAWAGFQGVDEMFADVCCHSPLSGGSTGRTEALLEKCTVVPALTVA